jgi:hypothetical protein
LQFAQRSESFVAIVPMQERLEAEERGRQKEAAQAARKKKTELMRKKTRKGQPVMKNRIEDLLSKIEAGMKAGR